MKSTTQLSNLRELHTLVMLPAGEVSDNAILQLIRIGCPVQLHWPPPKKLDFPVDIVITGIYQDHHHDDIKNLLSSLEYSVTVIALVDYESPTVLSKLVELGAHGVINTPFNAHNLFPTLITARRNWEELDRKNSEINKLKERMSQHKIINQAKVLLMLNHDLSEEDAHLYLSREAMKSRRAISDVSNDIVNKLNAKKTKK